MTSFASSFPLLPRRERSALRSVYAFCRATDDIVDEPGSAQEKAGRLNEWEEGLRRAFGGRGDDPILTAAAAVARNYGIPSPLFHDLVRGIRMDIGVVRYETFDDLLEYCRLVASTVGLICLHLFGRRNPRTEAYAGTLGVALQLTNIIRDVGADARMGRIYLPLAELRMHGCSEDEILGARSSDRFLRLMEYQSLRAAEWFERADAALDASDVPAMRPALVMQAVYRRILAAVRASEYDVFRRTIRVSRAGQVLIAIRHGVIPRMSFPGRRA